MKSAAKKLCAEAEKLGYVHSSTNSKGFMLYVGPDGHEVLINVSIKEHQAVTISKAMRRAAGTWQAPSARNSQAVKARQAKRRELDAERIAAERRELQSQRDAYLARIATAPLLQADRDALRRTEARLRELDEIESLMRSTPATGHQQGRAKHTSGRRESA